MWQGLFMILYKDIYDCPIENWINYITYGDSSYLTKDDDTPKDDAEDLLLKEKITNQIVDIFGVSIEYEMYFYKLRTLNNLEIKLLRGDESVLDKIELVKLDLDRLLEMLKKKRKKENPEVEKINIRKSYAINKRNIETFFTGRNTSKLTIFEYYNDLKDIEKYQKERQGSKHVEGNYQRNGGMDKATKTGN